MEVGSEGHPLSAAGPSPAVVDSAHRDLSLDPACRWDNSQLWRHSRIWLFKDNHRLDLVLVSPSHKAIGWTNLRSHSMPIPGPSMKVVLARGSSRSLKKSKGRRDLGNPFSRVRLQGHQTLSDNTSQRCRLEMDR